MTSRAVATPSSITTGLFAALAGPERAAQAGQCFAGREAQLAVMLEYHRLAPWLHRELSRSGALAQWPARVRATLEERRLRAIASTASRTEELRRLGQALQAAQVSAVLLKGAHAAYAYYPDPRLRPMGDVDLLIAESDLERTVGAMRQLGYEMPDPANADPAAHDLAQLRHVSAIPVDVHKHFEAPHFGTTIELGTVLARARSHPVAPHLRVFAPEDLLLHTCMHASLHNGWRVPLIALVDIRQILNQEPGLDWPALLERAQQWRALPHVAAALALVCGPLCAGWPRGVQKLLGSALPDSTGLQRVIEILCFDYACRNETLDALSLRLLNLRRSSSGRERARQALARLTGEIDESGRPANARGASRLRLALSAWRSALRGGLALLCLAASREQRRQLRALVDHGARRRAWYQAADPGRDVSSGGVD